MIQPCRHEPWLAGLWDLCLRQCCCPTGWAVGRAARRALGKGSAGPTRSELPLLTACVLSKPCPCGIPSYLPQHTPSAEKFKGTAWLRATCPSPLFRLFNLAGRQVDSHDLCDAGVDPLPDVAAPSAGEIKQRVRTCGKSAGPGQGAALL